MELLNIKFQCCINNNTSLQVYDFQPRKMILSTAFQVHSCMFCILEAQNKLLMMAPGRGKKKPQQKIWDRMRGTRKKVFSILWISPWIGLQLVIMNSMSSSSLKREKNERSWWVVCWLILIKSLLAQALERQLAHPLWLFKEILEVINNLGRS